MNTFYQHLEDSIRFAYRCFDRILINVWSAPPLQVSIGWMAEAVCVNVSVLVEPQLLALMEYARPGPYNGGGHDGPVDQSG